MRGVALSAGEREEISRGLAAGLSGRAIGRLLGRDGSVINKEIARCGGREAYRAQVAQRRAVRQRARPKLRTVEACPRLARLVSDGLARGWSPRQISGRLAREYPDRPDWQVSAETIYRALCCQARGQLTVRLEGCLRRGGTARVGRDQRRAMTTGREAIPDKTLNPQAGRGRRPGGARALGGRPDHGGGQPVGGHHLGRTHQSFPYSPARSLRPQRRPHRRAAGPGPWAGCRLCCAGR